jgi:hypothetical protein
MFFYGLRRVSPQRRVGSYPHRRCAPLTLRCVVVEIAVEGTRLAREGDSVVADVAQEIVPGDLIEYEKVPPVAGAQNSGQAIEYPEDQSRSLAPSEIEALHTS